MSLISYEADTYQEFVFSLLIQQFALHKKELGNKKAPRFREALHVGSIFNLLAPRSHNPFWYVSYYRRWCS